MTDQPQSPPTGEGDGRARLLGLGRVAGELLHDLALEVSALDTRARLVAGEARMGRFPVSDLERVVETTAELSEMLRDVLETLRGATVSPEVSTDVREAAERTIRRLLPGFGPVEVRLASSLPDGTAVRGRPSFLTRALANLLQNASRHAVEQVNVSLALENVEDGGDGAPRVVLAVEDDGPGLSPDLEDDPFPPGVDGGSALGMGAVAWAAEQLGGSVEYRRGAELGGARFEVRLPALLPGEYGDPAALRGRRVALLEPEGADDHFLRRYLLARGAEVVVVAPEEGEPLVEALARSFADVLLLDPEAAPDQALEAWDELRHADSMLAERTLFVSALSDAHPLLQEARETGRPVLARPVDPAELTRALDLLF